ncbi:hypothetical protein E2C01_043315 [Portunus trituberculatus]|uniref:Uncharacterized protein n=1 Tax=Portunus trituberculatus TaxID=210409 RepID=A0A5B7FSM6_PORTR|nr:hypothetical protein [Portunus trituberculatus]
MAGNAGQRSTSRRPERPDGDQESVGGKGRPKGERHQVSVNITSDAVASETPQAALQRPHAGHMTPHPRQLPA